MLAGRVGAEKDIPSLGRGPGEPWSGVVGFNTERSGQILGVFSGQSHEMY